MNISQNLNKLDKEMKCPKCGKETKNRKKCDKCGFVLNSNKSNDKFEVKYKEFKVSELLEIHKKPSTQENNKSQKETLLKNDDMRLKKKIKIFFTKNILKYTVILTVILILLFLVFYFFKKL